MPPESGTTGIYTYIIRTQNVRMNKLKRFKLTLENYVIFPEFEGVW